jgi:hypothetical protein
MGSAVYAPDEQADIPLHGDVSATDFILQDETLAEIGGLGAKSFLTHNATLERYRRQAENLADFLLSARLYAEARPRMVVLVQYQNNQQLICYDIKRQQLEAKTDLELLDWLACDEAEPKAPVVAATVEYAANTAVRQWCQENGTDPEAVSKLSAIYLLPKRAKASSMKQLLAALQKDLRASPTL